MLPLFGDTDRRHKRPINLGGTTSTTSHSSILDSAKARREERALHKRKSDAAAIVQGCWRGYRERCRLRTDLRTRLASLTEATASDDELLGALRAAVLVGDDEILAKWATIVQPARFTHFVSDDLPAFHTLLQKYSFRCLQSASQNPMSGHANQLLNLVFTMIQASQSIVQYLLSRNFYLYIEKILLAFPVASAKTCPLLPTLILLTVQPFSTPNLQETALLEACKHILPTPLLPNRLPIPSLTVLSAKLPLQSLFTIESSFLRYLDAGHLDLSQQAHLLSNLSTFTSPRYPKLSDPSKIAYLHLCTALMNNLPVGSIEPPPSKAMVSAAEGVAVLDSDNEDEPRGIKVQVVQSFNAPKPPSLDPKTYKRLANLYSASYLALLLQASTSSSSRRALCSYLVGLLSVTSSAVKRENTITAILVSAGPGLIRELWRGYVRPSSLGREMYGVTQPEHRAVLPCVLLLCDLYAQSLLTMGDDEFFGRVGGTSGTSHTLGDTGTTSGKLPSGSSTSSEARNPLTTDDIQTLTKQLVNVVWELYMRDDLTQSGPITSYSSNKTSSSSTAMDVDDASSPVMLVENSLRLSWEQIREKIAKLLTGVWARDSRNTFLPKAHWHVPLSNMDVKAFTDAALAEDENMTSSYLPDEDYRGWKRGTVMSKRQLALLSPRLGVLNNVPFVLPFEVRVEIFRHFIGTDKMKLGNSRYTFQGRSRMTRAVVRRGKVSEDGFNKLGDADLKAPIEITFIDQFGTEEAGIDGGGVFKEFFTELCKEVFDTDRGLWLANRDNELYPNPIAFATESHSLAWYRFIGRILGKAMYEGILVDVAFAGFFLAKWLGRASFLDDLASLDLELYNGLIFLKHYDGDLEDLALNFTIATEELGVTKTVDLIHNGSNVPVTKANRLQYIHLVSHYRLTKQIKKQSDAFFDGLSEIVDPKWLRMFNQQEVQILIGGVNAPIDIDDLRNHTQYGGLYDSNHETIIAFWNVVSSFDHEKRRQLLRFVTSCSRPPLLGFKELQPNFAIRDAGSHENRLPTASTCVNLLKLPRYTTERLLRAKLSQAISAGAGFDLS